MYAYVECYGPMPRAAPNPTSLSEIAERLRLTRAALGHSQAHMARLMGSSTQGQAWENYEKSRRRISLDHALALCARIGLTLEWIYRGNIHTLPADIGERIQLQLRLEAEQARRGRISRQA